jgi:predicted nucleic acid-binding protein
VKAILDTSVLIGTAVGDLPDEAAISVATLAELHFGVHLSKTEEIRRLRVRRLAEIEAHFDPLPVDAAVARSYGELASIVRSHGRKARTRVMDLLVAATAVTWSVPLYTRNLRDFDGLGDVLEVREV